MTFKFAVGTLLISFVAGCAAPAPLETRAASNTAAARPSSGATLPTPTPTPRPPEPTVRSSSGTGSAASSRPWTAAERELLSGIRADVLAVGCRPVDEELPPGATAGVGCDVRSELVEGIGFYQFDDLDALMAVYEARLAQYGIPLTTEVHHPEPGEPLHDCWRGHASESFYSPTGSTDGGMNREGCFINELGFANLRYVWGRSLVYIGVLGNNGDIEALKAWSWYDEAGEEPSFGGPGVWQPAP